jgi:tagatose 1,6-diphosphate aldolase GatY/KbaY
MIMVVCCRYRIHSFIVNPEVRQAYMQSLKDEICGKEPQDLLDVTADAIAAMQSVITAKMHLFGSVGQAHLHETPYAISLANQKATEALSPSW